MESNVARQNGVQWQALNQTEGVAALGCGRADFVQPLEWVGPTVGQTSFLGISMPFAYFQGSDVLSPLFSSGLQSGGNTPEGGFGRI